VAEEGDEMTDREYAIKFFGFGLGSKGDSGYGRGGDELEWHLASLVKAVIGSTEMWRHKASGSALFRSEVGDEAGSWATWAKRAVKPVGPGW
jgi:hypothetical protein